MEANASTWNKLMDIYFIDQDANILEYLTCSENPDILINFINTSLTNDLIMRNNGYYDIFSNIIQKHSDNDAVLEYWLANFKEIIPRKIRVRVLTGIIYNVHSHERLDKISDFVKTNFEESAYKFIQNYIEDQKSELASVHKQCSPFITKQNKTVKES